MTKKSRNYNIYLLKNTLGEDVMRNYDIITSLEKNGISIKNKKDIYLPSIYKKICEFCAILDYYVALYEFRNLNEVPSGTSLPWSYELYRIKLCTAIRDLANTCGCFPEKSFSLFLPHH